MSNVFKSGDAYSQVPRRVWFRERFQEEERRDTSSKRGLFKDVEDVEEEGKAIKERDYSVLEQKVSEILPVTPRKGHGLDALCDAALETPMNEEGTSKIKRKRSTPESPTRHLWPPEWELTFTSSSNSSQDDLDSAMPSFIPLYNSTNADLFVS